MVSHGCWFPLLRFGQRDQTGLAAFLEPVTLPADVDGGGVVQQPVEDGGGDDGVAEDGTPTSSTSLPLSTSGPPLNPESYRRIPPRVADFSTGVMGTSAPALTAC